jgi:glycosyltransferase involved in cell wall biosynthesis
LEIHVQVSVVIPCYNEVNTVLPLVESVLAAPFDKELILVDDGSTDGTRQVFKSATLARARRSAAVSRRRMGTS